MQARDFGIFSLINTKQDFTEAPHKSEQASLIRNDLEGKKIILLLYSLAIGGAECRAVQLARYLREKYRADAQIWAMAGAGPLTKLCEDNRVPWKVIQPRGGSSLLRAPICFLRTAWHLRRYRPDILMPYTLIPDVVCGLVWRLTGAATCIWNQTDAGHSVLIAKCWQTLAAKNTPLLISNSRHALTFLSETLGAKEKKCKLISNGILTASPLHTRDQWRKRIDVENSTLLVSMLANLRNPKDHATLLRSWSLVTKYFSSSSEKPVLALAGEYGDTYPSLKNLASDLDITHQVRFLGYVTDTSGLLHASDLAVFSSTSEGCPNAVLESMAAGLAVVATDIPGVREAVGPSLYEWLAPVGNASVLAEKILQLACNTQLRKEMGELGRERVLTHFSLRRQGEDIANVLQGMLSLNKNTKRKNFLLMFSSR